jgi:hypothetical protein
VSEDKRVNVKQLLGLERGPQQQVLHLRQFLPVLVVFLLVAGATSWIAEVTGFGRTVMLALALGLSVPVTALLTRRPQNK